MTYSTEWANVQGGEQMELATVIRHERSTSQQFYDNVMELDQYMDELMNSPDPAHKRSTDAHGIRLAKLLSQYDESPSSALWSEIQSVAREVLK